MNLFGKIKADNWSVKVDSVYGLGSAVTYDINKNGIEDVIVAKGYEDTAYKFVSCVIAF